MSFSKTILAAARGTVRQVLSDAVARIRSRHTSGVAARYVAEIMEPRRLLSTVNWTGNGHDGQWTDPANWDTNAAPTAGSDVVISAGSNTTVYVGIGSLGLNSLSSSSQIFFSFGSLSLASASNLSGGLTLNGGEIDFNAPSSTSSLSQQPFSTVGGGGSLTISGPYTWAGGTLAVASATAAGGITLQGGIENLSATSLTNSVGKTMTFGAGANLFLQSSGQLINNGAIISTGGQISSDLSSTAFNNVGSVTAQSGTFSIAAADTGGTSGGFSVSAGSTLTFSNNFTFNPASTISGAGTVTFAGGATTVNGNYNVSGTTSFAGGTVTFPGIISSIGALSVSGGTADFGNNAVVCSNVSFAFGQLEGTGSLSSSGLITWSGGTLFIRNTYANGGLDLHGNFSETLSQGTLTIPSGQTATIGASGNTWLYLQNGATVNNAGIFTASGGELAGGYPGPTGTLNNSGTFNVNDTTANPLVISGSILFNNSGNLTVQSGNFTLYASDGGSTAGSFTVAASAILAFSGSFNLTSTSSVAGAGTVQFTGGFVNIDGAYNVTGNTAFAGGGVYFQSGIQSLGDSSLTVAGGQVNFGPNNLTFTTVNISGYLSGSGSLTATGLLTLNSGTLQIATTTANGGIDIRGSGYNIVEGMLINPAGQTATIEGTHSLWLINGTFNNAGTIHGISGGINGNDVSGGNGILINSGIVNADASASTFSSNLGSVTIANSGLIEASSGTLAIGEYGYASSGTYSLAGNYSVSAGATLTFSGTTSPISIGASSMISGAGTVQFTATTLNVNCSYNISGATVASSGTVTFNGAVGNVGSVPLTVSAPAYYNATTVNFVANNLTVSGLNLSGGLITGTGTLTINGPMNWSGGEISMGTTFANGGISITGTANKFVGAGNLINASGQTAIISGTGTIWTDGGNFQNLGTLTANAGNMVYNGGPDTGFYNSGTFNIDEQDATFTFGISVNFGNSGTINLIHGGLNFGDSTNTGAFHVAAGCTLTLSPFEECDFGGSSLIDGAGTVIFSCSNDHAPINIAGTYNVTGASTVSGGYVNYLAPIASFGTIGFTASRGQFNFGSNNVTLPALALNGTIAGSGTLTINGLLTGGGQLSIAQTMANGGVSLTNSGLNVPGRLTSPAGQTVSLNGSSIAGTFVNNGQLNSSNNSSISGTFTNAGNVSVTGGTLILYASDPGMTNGNVTVAAGAKILVIGSYTFSAQSSVGGAGIIQINGGTTTLYGSYNVGTTLATAGSVYFNSSSCSTSALTLAGVGMYLRGSGSLTVSGLFDWTNGGLIVMAVTAAGTLDVHGTGGSVISGTLTNSGVATIESGTLSLWNNAHFVNSGSFSAVGGSVSFTNNGGPLPTFLNSGTLNISDPGTFSIGAGVTFTNTGSVTITGGTLDLSGSDGGGNTGSFAVSTGATLNFSTSYSLMSSAVISGAGIVSVAYGVLSLAAAQALNGVSLVVAPGAEVVMTGSSTTNSVSSLTLTSGGTLDLGRSTLVIAYATAADPISAVMTYLAGGFDAGKWDGTGLISSAAAKNAAQTTAIGYADSADGLIPGQPANTIELRYTLYGDTTLSASVGFNDFTRLTQHYNQTIGGTWDTGDFNYDGSINAADFTLMTRTYNTNLGSQAVPAVSAGSRSLPQPNAGQATAAAGPASSAVSADPTTSTKKSNSPTPKTAVVVVPAAPANPAKLARRATHKYR